MSEIPKAAAPLSKPSEGIVGIFHTGIIWDGQNHTVKLNVPMKFEQVSGSKGSFSVITDIAVRSNDEDFWSLVDKLGQEFIDLTKKFEDKISTLNLESDEGMSPYRTFLTLGKLHKLDSLRLIAEKTMMSYFHDRYSQRIGRDISHKVLGFGPVKLPATLTYYEDDSPSELLIRHISNLSKVQKTMTSMYNAKMVWAALCHLFRLKSWGPIVWLYFNTASLGLQGAEGQSVQGTQLLIARLLDRINMSPYDFSNVDVSGYLASVMMLHAGYNLSADRITAQDWISPFPIQILHDFSVASATEHYNGQVDLLAKCGWKRDGGSLAISACPFYSEGGPGTPGIYDITISDNPDKSNHVTIPLDWGGENFKQDGTAIPEIPATFDRMFGWRHDPEAQGVTLNVETVLPWMLLTAPPPDHLHSSIEFWNLFFYTVKNTGFTIIDDTFHPSQWFVGFDSILPGNGFPITMNGDNKISAITGWGRSRRENVLEWLSDRAFKLTRTSHPITSTSRE
jgi:hypothetical protein